MSVVALPERPASRTNTRPPGGRSRPASWKIGSTRSSLVVGVGQQDDRSRARVLGEPADLVLAAAPLFVEAADEDSGGMKVARAKGRLRGKQPKLTVRQEATSSRCTRPVSTPAPSSRSCSVSPAPPCTGRSIVQRRPHPSPGWRRRCLLDQHSSLSDVGTRDIRPVDTPDRRCPNPWPELGACPTASLRLRSPPSRG